jgi:hypothetical protein
MMEAVFSVIHIIFLALHEIHQQHHSITNHSSNKLIVAQVRVAIFTIGFWIIACDTNKIAKAFQIFTIRAQAECQIGKRKRRPF